MIPAANFAEAIANTKNGFVAPAWVQWFQQASLIMQGLQMTGATASRPSKALYQGRMFFDTTLGYPVWFKSQAVGTNGTLTSTWVNASGSSV